ncbi:MAG: ATP-grasp domain-containing protein [Planctomycetota bacterium]
MPKKRNLVILVPLPEHSGTMGTVANHVREIAPDIAVHVVRDERRRWKRRLLALRPTLVFSPARLQHRVGPKRANVFQGADLGKSEESKRLEAAGVPVPRWTLLREGENPDLQGFGPYVVRKPDGGARGADVKIIRRGRVKWRRPTVARNNNSNLMVQEFVYTGPYPVSYRVSTLLGEVLWATRVEASRERRPLPTRHAFGTGGVRGGGVSIVANTRDSTWTLTDDAEILALARRAAAALPEIPLLGVDLVRDADTGEVFVIEVNPSGWTWHFSSHRGVSIQRDNNIDFDAQFGGLRRAAEALVRVTREQAR